MAQWRISNLSKLTKISPRALRHYDQLGLLKPSVRMANGYRVYSKDDLAKLQQNIGMKAFW